MKDNSQVWVQLWHNCSTLDSVAESLAGSVINFKQKQKQTDEQYFGMWLDIYLLLEEVMSKESL